jgi:translation initiation factor 4G
MAWKEENEVSKAIRAKAEEKKRKEELVLTRKAMAALEKQERARLEALADLKEKMKGKEALALAQGAKMAELAAEDERKAQILQKEIKRKAEEAFQEMQRKKEQKKLELIKGLEEMKKEQEKVKEKEKEAELHQAILFKKSCMEGLKKDVEKREVYRNGGLPLCVHDAVHLLMICCRGRRRSC